MAVLDPIKPTILATRVIPNVDRGLAAKLDLRDDQRSIALVTCDIDDSLYVSLDEATKMADVEVVYAHSFYAGSAHASGPLSGEIIGILAAPDPAEARAGLAACIDYAENAGVVPRGRRRGRPGVLRAHHLADRELPQQGGRRTAGARPWPT